MYAKLNIPDITIMNIANRMATKVRVTDTSSLFLP